MLGEIAQVTMRKPMIRIATRLLLSALVLAWGIVPLAIRHGHEGGDKPSHRHHAVAHHGHDHDDHGHSTDEDSQPAGLDVSPAVLSSLVIHLHWRLFGVEFSVPVSEDEQPEDGSNAAKPAVVRLVDSVPNPVIDHNRLASSSLATSAQPGLDSPVVPTSSLTTAGPRPSRRLCDRVRDERSGVLLV